MLPNCQLIPNSEYPKWKAAVRELDMERLGGAAVDEYDHIDPWWEKGVYCWSGMTDASGKLVSQISTLLVSFGELEDFCDGKLLETDLKGYDWQCYSSPHLYWATLILKEKIHAPFLFRSVCRANVEYLTKFQVPEIGSTFCVPASRESRLLLMRFKNAKQRSLYRGKYPILLGNIKDFTCLDALLARYRPQKF